MNATGATEGDGPLAGRHIVLGVTGGIAAYKAIEVCRRLIDAGAYVAPVLTEGAQRFVGAATFSALASEPAQSSLFDGPHPIPHTRLGQRTDLVLVAPATARVLSDLTTGRSDDLLVATLLATEAPVMVAPAMHTEMWRHPSVVDNLAVLRRRGVVIVDPESGRLAGGDVGEGRLAGPERIVDRAIELLTAGSEPAALPAGARPLPAASGDAGMGWRGRRVLVSAGGTREAIDPVRYLGNRSTGKQGHALAEEAAQLGAAVTLVTTSELPTSPAIERRQVTSAAEMADAVLEAAPSMDLVIMAAAVADFTPAAVADRKLKRPMGRRASSWSPPRTSSPSWDAASLRRRCWSALRRRPTMSRPTQPPNSSARAPTCSSSTTSVPPGWGSATTPTRCSSSATPASGSACR